ncbi:hypothetical protein KJ693_10325 [bacterium]|nr:hypothetical protein [bacterium]
MQAVREFRKVVGNRLTIDLPDSFYTKEVEVIIIPYKNESVPSIDDRNEWKKDFSSISQWDITEKEIRMKSWPIEEF